MDLDFYGLNEMPFGLTPDPKYIFKTESHLEALATIRYAVEHNKGLVVVTGEVQCVYTFNPFLTAAEFYERLADEFELGLKRTASKPELLSALGQTLALRHSNDLRTVLVVDEAHGLPSSLLEEIRLLMNFETNSEKLLQVILSGQPELQEVLNRPELRQLKQRVALRCEVKALSLFEINKYVRFRLKQAGARNVNLFDNGAIGLIGNISQGIPRVVNNVCDNALLYGYAASADMITRNIIAEVIEGLDLTPATRSHRSFMFDDEASGSF